MTFMVTCSHLEALLGVAAEHIDPAIPLVLEPSQEAEFLLAGACGPMGDVGRWQGLCSCGTAGVPNNSRCWIVGVESRPRLWFLAVALL